MKNALEMNKIANEANEKFLAEMKEKAHEAVEKIVAPIIEKEASFGGFSAKCHIGTDVDLEVVIADLENLGYNVSKNGRTLSITWYDWNIK